MWQPKPAHRLTITDVTAKARTQADSHWCDSQLKPAHRLTVTDVTAKARTQADSHWCDSQLKPAHRLTVTDVTAKARTQADSHWCTVQRSPHTGWQPLVWQPGQSPHTGWQSLVWQPKPAHRLKVTDMTAKARIQTDNCNHRCDCNCQSVLSVCAIVSLQLSVPSVDDYDSRSPHTGWQSRIVHSCENMLTATDVTCITSLHTCMHAG